MTRTASVAELEGVTCNGLLAQECYFQGELVESANVVFVAIAPDRWLRFFIDCGSFGISEAAEVKEMGSEDTDPEFRYPLVDVGARYPVVGRRIVSATIESAPSDWAQAAELRLMFDDGGVLTLVNRDDVSSLEYQRAAG